MANFKNGAPKPKRNLKTSFSNTTEAFEAAMKASPQQRAKYILRLYVSGSSTRSLRAVYDLKKLCEEYLGDNYDLEVIDIYENPGAGRREQIIAAPTLIKSLPRPLRRFVGDLSNSQKILVGLDIYKRQDPEDQLRGAD
jgi:circadian clock protein KaiB